MSNRFRGGLVFLEVIKVNKFDALKQFQSWPREWQELCGEYWAECEESFTLPSPTQDQPKAAPKVAVSNPSAKPASDSIRECKAYTLEELKYAQDGIALGIKDIHLAASMAERFHRTRKAFQNYISLIRKDGIDLSTGRKKPIGAS
jgi:hypothetical protein